MGNANAVGLYYIFTTMQQVPKESNMQVFFNSLRLLKILCIVPKCAVIPKLVGGSGHVYCLQTMLLPNPSIGHCCFALLDAANFKIQSLIFERSWDSVFYPLLLKSKQSTFQLSGPRLDSGKSLNATRVPTTVATEPARKMSNIRPVSNSIFLQLGMLLDLCKLLMYDNKWQRQTWRYGRRKACLIALTLAAMPRLRRFPIWPPRYEMFIRPERQSQLRATHRRSAVNSNIGIASGSMYLLTIPYTTGFSQGMIPVLLSTMPTRVATIGLQHRAKVFVNYDISFHGTKTSWTHLNASGLICWAEALTSKQTSWWAYVIKRQREEKGKA